MKAKERRTFKILTTGITKLSSSTRKAGCRESEKVPEDVIGDGKAHSS